MERRMIRQSCGLIILTLFFSVLIFTHDTAFSTKIQKIRWYSYDDGMARGKSEEKKVFLHFTAAWCYYCGVMENEAFKDPVIIASLNRNFIAIKVEIHWLLLSENYLISY